MALIILIIAWQVQVNVVERINILEGQSHYVNFMLPFVYVRSDRNDIVLFN